MSGTISIEFVLHGRVEGVEITPRTISLSLFNEFNLQVEAFLSGQQRVKVDDVQLEILPGSYVLRTLVPVVLLASLESDLGRLTREDALGELDPRRAEVIQKWQARARGSPELRYEVRPQTETMPKVRITSETDFRIGEVVPWVAVEKYLFGQVMDMGGAQKANIHLKLDRGRKTVVVGATQDYLREQVENRLYHKVLLHVRAEQHIRTGELRNVRLLSFVDYQPGYNEEALDRFVAKGTAAWAEVPDAAGWVRELRGGCAFFDANGQRDFGDELGGEDAPTH